MTTITQKTIRTHDWKPELSDAELAILRTTASAVLADRFGHHSEVWRNGRITQATVHPNLLTANFSVEIEGVYIQAEMDFTHGTNRVAAWDKYEENSRGDWKRLALGDVLATVKERRVERAVRENEVLA